MGRKRLKPEYNSDQILKELMEICKKLYLGTSYVESGNVNDTGTGSNGRMASLRSVAEELDISVSKVVKLLITAGVYTSEMSEQIRNLYETGKGIADIQNELGISRATVHYYLPYRKGIYNAKEISLNADRIKKYRLRYAAIESLKESRDVNDLWRCIELFESYTFYTARGLKYRYTVKGGEIFVNRKEESKSITRSTVELAFKNGMELMETSGVVTGPKKLGTFGASYLYPMFIRFGVISGK